MVGRSIRLVRSLDFLLLVGAHDHVELQERTRFRYPLRFH